jgi:valyl-tRNA synthetase
LCDWYLEAIKPGNQWLYHEGPMAGSHTARGRPNGRSAHGNGDSGHYRHPQRARGDEHLTLQTLAVAIQPEIPEMGAVISNNRELIANLARLNKMTVSAKIERPKAAATVLINGATVYVLLEGIVDFAKEQVRLEKEIGKMTRELLGMNKKLGNADFLSKAPEKVVNSVREKHAAMLEKQQALETTLERITNMMA